MFFEANSITVNLKNVSNVNLIPGKRIIFNMNYTIGIPRGDKTKYISDYVYWDAGSRDEYMDNLESLKRNPYVNLNFLSYNDVMINTNEISSVKFDELKSRVIFNLSHPVTFTSRGTENITSEFVYLNTPNNATFKELQKTIKKELQEW